MPFVLRSNESFCPLGREHLGCADLITGRREAFKIEILLWQIGSLATEYRTTKCVQLSLSWCIGMFLTGWIQRGLLGKNLNLKWKFNQEEE